MITIIVLLILAGISIMMLTGQNGILSRVAEAKQKTEDKGAEEKIKLAVMGTITDEGKLTVPNLGMELLNYGGTVEGEKFPVTVIMDDKKFKVDKNGNVTLLDETSQEEISAQDYVYAILYTDGELVLSANSITPEKEVDTDYGFVELTDEKFPSWTGFFGNDKIKIARIEGEIKPVFTCMMFYDCENLTEIKNIENIDTSECINMGSMFNGCSNLKEIDLSGFNTEKVQNIGGMFMDCEKLTGIDINTFDTSNVTVMKALFTDCKSVTNINFGKNFKTDKVTNMDDMFFNCIKLTSLNLSSFNTENVTSMDAMFTGLESIKSLDLNNFKTENLTNMRQMFYGCKNLETLDLTSFNTSNVTNMYNLFCECSNLKTINVSSLWDTSKAATNYMFDRCGTDHVTKNRK